MSLLSDIGGWFSGINWLKVSLIGAAVAGLVGTISFGVHRIGLSYTYEEDKKQLQVDLKNQHDTDQKSIDNLKHQYALDAAAANKEKNDAVNLARKSQEQIDKIKNSKAGDDGPIRPVLSDTLNWMRGQSTDNVNRSSKDLPAR